MAWLIAAAHIGGSILVLMILSFAALGATAWWGRRIDKQTLQELAGALGVSIDALDTPEVAPRLIQLSSERHSNELLRNRLSDLCGVVSTLWNWLSWTLQVVVPVGVIWFTLTDSRDAAVFAWTVVPLWLFFWVTSVAFSLVCKVLTGRYPGQAKAARKSLAEYMTKRQHG